MEKEPESGGHGETKRQTQEEKSPDTHLILVPHGIQLLQLLGPVAGLLFRDVWKGSPGCEPGSPCLPFTSSQCVLQAYRAGLQWFRGEEGRTGWRPDPSLPQQCLENKWRMGEEMNPSITRAGELWVLGRMMWGN